VLAIYLLAGERAVQTRDPLTVLCFALLFAAVVWSVLQPWWTYPFAELAEETSLLGNLDHLSAPVWTLALWTIVLGTIVPFGLTIGALRHLAATRVGITMTFEPVAATLVAWAWLGETLSAAQVAGGAIVLTGILLAQTSR
jgi:drug/metabolite transporter (DMT)-like permease